MLRIRGAEPRDVPVLLELIRALAAYEKEPDAVGATEEDLLRDGFGPHPRYFALVAEWNGEVAGFAFWFHTYSTWLGRWGVYLQDLFVPPETPGEGVGEG